MALSFLSTIYYPTHSERTLLTIVTLGYILEALLMRINSSQSYCNFNTALLLHVNADTQLSSRKNCRDDAAIVFREDFPIEILYNTEFLPR